MNNKKFRGGSPEKVQRVLEALAQQIAEKIHLLEKERTRLECQLREYTALLSTQADEALTPELRSRLASLQLSLPTPVHNNNGRKSPP